LGSSSIHLPGIYIYIGVCMVQNLTVHWHSCRALLCDLQEATHTNTQGQLTIAWCPDHVVVGRTRSAHAGAPSGMLFIEQKGQEFIFCESWQRPSRPCHSSWCFLFHLRPSSLLKPTGSTPEFHTAVTKPTLGPGHGGVCHRDSVTVQGE